MTNSRREPDWVLEQERCEPSYPGAHHAFDAEAPPHYFAGHYIGREPVAAADALTQTRAFFSARLGSPLEVVLGQRSAGCAEIVGIRFRSGLPAGGNRIRTISTARYDQDFERARVLAA